MRRIGDDVYASVLSDHHQLVRDGLAAHDGKEEGTNGDSFFATFTSPSACLAAALQIQRTLSGHAWPAGELLRVRMGIHTGEASEASTGLVGYEVHRAARIAAVAHGGQILLSSAAAGLVEDTLTAEVALRDLGSHRLKDLGRPETIFQVVTEGLRAEFPPLRSLDNPELPNNLPASLNPFIGRAVELAEVRDLVIESRLVTLTGAGGSGKTRLALQAAAELLDGSGEGVWFVELAPVSDADQIPTSVIEALGVRQEADRTALESVLHVLRDQDALIVLDNCEHVIDEVAKFADLVGRNCPKVSLLTTSREPLGVDGELVYRVRSLSLPEGDVEDVGDVEGSEAVELFVARARARDTTFALDDAIAPMVASVCRRLDGIPLAIELAAARLSSMSLVDMSRRLDQRFRLLTGGSRNALPRQQTLGAMVAWSYDLLNEPEREVLRRLTVFVDGFDLDAAEAVCAAGTVDAFDVADILGSLVNKSLVTAERTSGTLRYGLLETIRQYAVEQLLQVDGDEEAHEARRLHAEHYLALAEEAELELDGHGQVGWVRRLITEWDNLLSAFEFFAYEPGRSDDVLRLAVAISTFILIRQVQEVGQYIEDALGEGPHEPARLRARARCLLAQLRHFGTDEHDAIETLRGEYQASIDEALAVGDSQLESNARSWLSGCLRGLGRFDEARQLAEEALATARRLGDPNLIGQALFSLAHAAEQSSGSRNMVESEPLHLEALSLFRQSGDMNWVCAELISLSIVELFKDDDWSKGMAYGEEAAAIAEELGANWALPIVWGNLGIAFAIEGDPDRASDYARKATRVTRRLGRADFHQTFNILVLSWCAAERGDGALAAMLDGAHQVLKDAIPEHADLIWSDPEVQLEADTTARIAEALGAVEAARLTALGRELQFDRVLDLALGRSRSVG